MAQISGYMLPTQILESIKKSIIFRVKKITLKSTFFFIGLYSFLVTLMLLLMNFFEFMIVFVLNINRSITIMLMLEISALLKNLKKHFVLV